MNRSQMKPSTTTTRTARITYSNRLSNVADRLPVGAELNAREDEHERERQRAQGGEHDERHERHVGDAGREGHQGADHRDQPPEEGRLGPVLGEERIGPIEVLGRDPRGTDPSVRGAAGRRSSPIHRRRARRRSPRSCPPSHEDDVPRLARSAARCSCPGRRGSRRTAGRARRGSG